MDSLTAHPARSRWWPLVAICLGTFILLVDVTIVSVALPPMARDLHTQLNSLQWVVDAYALALAALLLVSGSLADRFGRRRLFQLGLALFAVSSLACALVLHAFLAASSGWVSIIAGLAVTGIGVGLAAPVLVSATLEAVPRPRSGMASGAINTFRQIGYALGIAAFGSLFASHITRAVITSADHHVTRAAYVAAQNEIYLV
ncbi:MAG TPA: MFS transporter, partial [Streptosporangiaceae bacterium]|nr:MFS transporter [Streptosporangiaceae bacterium]